MKKMKYIGVPWIGEIPSDWKMIAIKYLAYYNSDTLEETTDETFEFDYIDIGSVVNGQGITQLQHMNFASAPSRARRIVQKGDVILSTVRTYLKAVATIEEFVTPQIVSTGFIVLRAKEQAILARFLYFAILSENFISEVEAHSVGISYPAINASSIVTFKIPTPSLSIQSKIVSYLDAKCGKIDSIITREKAIIKKLKEYKLSMITETVTTGLNPNTPMKDSGIEWIGKIPGHWKLVPFKHILRERTEKNVPVQTDERLSLSIDKGVTLYSEKTTNLDRFKDDVSQYKLAHIGDLVLNSMNMIVGAVGISNYFGCVSPAYYTYYDNEENHVTARFCDYLFRSKTIKKVLFSLGKGIMAIDRGDDKINTCRLKVSRDDLRSLKLPLPDTCEQATIIDFLDKKNVEINSAIAKKQSIIDKLTEYKKSLIYEVVTGKKEV
ncbi:hypothetical protein SDC9_20893 [bioreactor metagenome]|uniref:Type I restriction modification DNA specificity domain-containing protein n=1 Tax=bioreactor metagenome TaxID=1076179 RepID=A0A644U8D8_9ZZZZ